MKTIWTGKRSVKATEATTSELLTVIKWYEETIVKCESRDIYKGSSASLKDTLAYLKAEYAERIGRK